MFDFYASEPHYAEHLLPVWFALPEAERGEFFGPQRIGELLASEGIHPRQSAPSFAPTPVVVAGWKDIVRCPQRPVALLEHGAGQTYLDIDEPSYAGGRDRDRVSLFLCPSEWVAEKNRVRYPEATAVAVGCPKLDRWAGSQVLGEPEVPTIGVSFHWNCRLIPETRWAFPAFSDQLIELAKDPRYRVIGHGHPRDWGYLRDFYEKNGIEAVADFDEVIARASVYVVDNSSTLYEATVADIPTVVLNAPWYRKDVNHGLRFWDVIPGLQCEASDDLREVVDAAYSTRDASRFLRQAVSEAVYVYQGVAAPAAAGALRTYLKGSEGEGSVYRQGRNPYRAKPRRLAPILPERRFTRLGANGLVLHEARLRWVEMAPHERAEEQARLAALTDWELSSALAETLADEVMVGG